MRGEEREGEGFQGGTGGRKELGRRPKKARAGEPRRKEGGMGGMGEDRDSEEEREGSGGGEGEQEEGPRRRKEGRERERGWGAGRECE